tara:strand:- start:1057 stop:1803 length:747 start_codon:yes stop_codon:yes gene_type:complete
LENNQELFNLIVILVEPNGPLNVGSVARLCTNFNVSELRIVSPNCDIYSSDSKRMAMKGISYINNSIVYKSLSDALLDCDLVLATYGRISLSKEESQSSLQEVSKWINNFKNINNLAIVFGREDRGLSNDELLLAQKVFTIETFNNPSLNLSHAVSIVLYEFCKDLNRKNIKFKKRINLANPIDIENTFKDLDKLLLKIGYLLPHTSKSKISKFKKYILKAETSKKELDTIRGIIHQINWALKNNGKK